jgi:hypothetical protein
MKYRLLRDLPFIVAGREIEVRLDVDLTPAIYVKNGTMCLHPHQLARLIEEGWVAEIKVKPYTPIPAAQFIRDEINRLQEYVESMSGLGLSKEPREFEIKIVDGRVNMNPLPGTYETIEFIKVREVVDWMDKENAGGLDGGIYIYVTVPSGFGHLIVAIQQKDLNKLHARNKTLGVVDLFKAAE